MRTSIINMKMIQDTLFRSFLDIGHKEEKPDYFHKSVNTFNLTMIPFEVIEKNVSESYNHVGNPSASKKVLTNVWIRLLRAIRR